MSDPSIDYYVKKLRDQEGGSAQAFKRLMINNFTVLSFVVLLGAGLALDYWLAQRIEQTMIEGYTRAALNSLQSDVSKELTAEDFKTPMSGERYAEFKLYMDHHSMGDVVQVKVWNRSGTIVFSNDPKVHGKKFPVKGDLKQALVGTPMGQVSGMQDLENASYSGGEKKLIEVYMPVKMGGGDGRQKPAVVGAYEVYMSLVPLRRNISEMQRYLATGLTVLFVALFGVMQVAGRALVRLNRGLHEANERVVSDHRIIEDILSITTLTENEAGRGELARSLAEQAGRLTSMAHVGVFFTDRNSIRFEGGYNMEPELVAFVSSGTNAYVRTALREGRSVMSQDFHSPFHHLGHSDHALMAIPILSHSGEIIGVIVAIGEQLLATKRSVTMLEIVSRRIGSEITLKDFNSRLESEVSTRTEELGAALQAAESANEAITFAKEEAIFRLLRAAEYRDDDTGEHIKRMAEVVAVISTQMGLPQEEVRTLRLASPMHDIGKIGIPDQILLKPGPLDAQELMVMRTHTTIGANILSGSESKLLKVAEEIALTHHERWDGSGYPRGISGEEIPLSGRICSLADVMDALLSKRSYKEPFSMEKATAAILQQSGKAFDPAVVAAFEATVDCLEAIYRFSPASPAEAA